MVVSIVALASSGVGFALQDNASQQIEQEGQRLAAMLEIARAQSRRTGQPWVWTIKTTGFSINQTDQTWLNPNTQAKLKTGPSIVLGPEPLIEPQSIQLQLNEHVRWVTTNGLKPFTLSQTP